MRTFALDWQGWVESKSLPDGAGIYCVWAAPVYKNSDGGLTINNQDAKLVYIGQAGDLNARVANHEKWPDWRRARSGDGDRIVFSYMLLPTSQVDESWRLSVENCLIAHHRPPCNADGLTYGYKLSVVCNNLGVTFGKLTASHKCKGSDDPADR